MKFAVCINNNDYEASLEKGKIYQVIEDKKSQKQNLIRIIDESGEDYLYSSDLFEEIKIPKKIEEAIFAVK